MQGAKKVMIRRSLISFAVVAFAFATGVACGRKSDADLSREPLAKGRTTVVGASAEPAKKSEELPAPAKTAATTSTGSPAVDDAKPIKPVSATKSVAAASDIVVKRIVVTRAIENREPVATTEFSVGDEPVFAFLELENKSDAPAVIRVTFEHASGKTVGHVKLEVPAHQTRWRTWGKTRFIRQPGSWNAVVRSEGGEEISRKSFEVGA